MITIAQVIIRHLGREARAIRDLLITCLSIKDTNKKSAKIAVKTIILQGSDLARNLTLENDDRGLN